MSGARRIYTRDDSVRRNRSYVSHTSAKEISKPGEYTPILAANITLETVGSVVIYTAASVAVKSPTGYGKLRVRWQQGGLYHTITESEGKVLPLGGEEYHRHFPVTGLTPGDTIGVTLEGMPVGATLSADRGNLLLEEW